MDGKICSNCGNEIDSEQQLSREGALKLPFGNDVSVTVNQGSGKNWVCLGCIFSQLAQQLLAVAMVDIFNREDLEGS